MLDNLHFIIPELIIAFGAMLVLMIGVFSPQANHGVILSTRLSVILLLGALFAVFVGPVNNTVIFSGLYHFDNFGIFTKALLIFAASIVLILSFDWIEDKTNKQGFEYPILIMLSLLGMMVLISANDLLTLYLGLELQSLSLYILAAIKREDKRATESAIKYFVLGALASGILLYGASLVYGYLGSTNFSNIALVLHNQAALSKGAVIGLVFVIAGFCFKISAAPFHMWAPDVYEGVPTPVTAYFAIVPKLAAMGLFIRVLVSGPFHHYAMQWQQVIIVISVLSMVVGSFGAIWQSNIKRLLAYSSIGHMGYAFLGLVANTEYGVQSILAYFVIYMLSSIVIFAILLALKSRQENGDELIEKIDDFKGLASRHPVIALIFAMLMFSMIGLPFPPFPGFFAKLFVFTAVIQQGFYALAVIGMATSLVGAYYYLRIVKIMYFDKAEEKTRISLNLNFTNSFVIAIITLTNLYLFVSPSTLIDWAYSAASSLF